MRIGGFVCHCGSNIGGTVDCAQVAKNALGFADVVYATDLMYTCAEQIHIILRNVPHSVFLLKNHSLLLRLFKIFFMKNQIIILIIFL